MFKWLVLAVLLVSATPTLAQTTDFRLAGIFSTGMVLQRDEPVTVWGYGNPGLSLDVNLDTQKASATIGSDGRWQVIFNPLPVGGPYKLDVSSNGTTLSVDDILSGDVWLCAGQSNMQMSVKETSTAEEAIAAAPNFSKLRLLTVPKFPGSSPSKKMDGKWKASSAESAANFSAVGFYFATALLKDPTLKDVPMGIIDSSFGGTAIEGWIPKEGLSTFPPEKMSASMFNFGPSSLYNNMIAPLAPFGLRGVIWYQGEANAGKPEVYDILLNTLASQWRQLWSAPKLPFLIVQLPPYASQFNGNFFTWLREAQARAVQKTPNMDLAITIDTADGSNLHPPTKQAVGERVALLARRDVYGENLVASGPVFKGAVIEGSNIRATFDPVGHGLAIRAGNKLHGFALAGDDGVFQFAHATIDGNSVVLHCDQVPEPKMVRYAWAGVPEADLINGEGLPAAPFRTDTLPISNLEFDREPSPHTLSNHKYEITINGKGKVTSLVVGGQQFISNGLGSSSGTSVPGGMGPRDLARIEQLADNSISCRDGNFSLTVVCHDTSMEWLLHNGETKGSVQLRIGLAPWVTISQQDNETTLSSDKTHLQIEGALKVNKPEAGGCIVTTDVPAHSDIKLVFTITNM